EERVAVGLSHNDVEALACWCEARPLWHPDSPRFSMPMLAYWGSEESPPRQLLERFGPPKLEHFEVPGADHYGAFARATDVLPKVAPFLQRTATATPHAV
ncbi:MAG TPA: hypothetical protein VHJ79_07755, partial [Mycobacterium sp.]|nr:hypothetical protein [Mycobacterium sp.]